jgi:hypothetical protein
MFAARHRFSAVPGISLTWALAVGSIRWRLAKPLFCGVLAASTAAFVLGSARTGVHLPSWKHALQVAESNSSVDHAPVLMCSPYVESDFVTMPVATVKDTMLYAPLTYYRISAPVIPLPADVTSETERVGSQFLRESSQKQERFLVIAYVGTPNSSYPTIQWIEKNAAEAYTPRWLGIFDGVAVVEFVPHKMGPR